MARKILDEAASALNDGFDGIQVSDEDESWTISLRVDIVSLRFPPWPLLGIPLADAERIVQEEELEALFGMDS